MGDGRPVQRLRLATGIDVSYVARGAAGGTPLVLLHAWVESLGSFDRLLPVLPATVRVAAEVTAFLSEAALATRPAP